MEGYGAIFIASGLTRRAHFVPTRQTASTEDTVRVMGKDNSFTGYTESYC